MKQEGKFITFEGVDGAGKSSHIPWLAEHLRQQGFEVVVTREPGGTPLAEELRALLLNSSMDKETEALLMFAARKEHLQHVILPALARGAWVLSDRFTDSSFAYQGGGRGVPIEKLKALEQWIGAPQPDLTLFFDVPVEVAESRRQAVRVADKFEAENKRFFDCVRKAFHQRVDEYPDRFLIVDATPSVEQIRSLLLPAFMRRVGISFGSEVVTESISIS